MTELNRGPVVKRENTIDTRSSTVREQRSKGDLSYRRASSDPLFDRIGPVQLSLSDQRPRYIVGENPADRCSVAISNCDYEVSKGLFSGSISAIRFDVNLHHLLSLVRAQQRF